MSEKREILFRGKRVDNGEWIEGGFVPSLDGKRFYIGNMFECVEIIPETRSEFTGLTDKNGTRIFEGDIIEYEGERYSINYLTRYARFSAVKPKTVFCVFAYQCGEVIGNIHDNPELLKGE